MDNDDVSAARHQAQPSNAAFIIRCGDVYYVTTELLEYDPNSREASASNRQYIFEELVPFYETLTDCCEARRIPGLPAGLRMNATAVSGRDGLPTDRGARLIDREATLKVVIKPEDH